MSPFYGNIGIWGESMGHDLGVRWADGLSISHASSFSPRAAVGFEWAVRAQTFIP